MKLAASVAAILLALGTGCGAPRGAPPDAGPDAGPDGGPDAGEDGGPDGGADGGVDGGPDGGGDGGFITEPMPIISQGAPAYSSGNQSAGAPPSNADDANPASAWVSDALPAWIAYDLSGVTAAKRQNVLVAWYDYKALDFLNPTPSSSLQLPTSYSLEANTAAGGGSPPTAGWTQLASVSGNIESSRQHLVNLAGANWLRMSISQGSDANNVAVDLDVHSAPSGATDSWLFMGDSITFISLPRAFSDLPALVQAAKPAYYPAIIDAAIGGTSTSTALLAIDDTLAHFPGRFVVLAYGTNDHPAEFQMEALVKKVIAAGKVPVVPHMPWSDQRTTEGPQNNAIIDALYAAYPEIVRGPDLWSAFLGRTDLIPAGDVHPNSQGQEVLRQQWAAAMAKIYQ
jgi:hypothetical protein